MSVPSSKATVTTERPYLETERTSSTFGMPDIARSTGTVTYCSTSIGESAGAGVMICTWTLVMSGTASMGRSTAERTPTMIRRAVARRTIARWRSDQATMRPRKITSLLLAEGALQDRALEREDAVDNHLLAGAQAAQDFDATAGGAAHRDRVSLEVAVGLADEDDLLVGHARDGGKRDDYPLGRGFGRPDDHPRSAEQPHLDEIAVIADQDARRDRPRGRVELPADGLDLPLEHLARIGVEADLGARAHLHPGKVLLEQAGQEVDGFQIAHPRDHVFGVDRLSLHGVAAEDEACER